LGDLYEGGRIILKLMLYKSGICGLDSSGHNSHAPRKCISLTAKITNVSCVYINQKLQTRLEELDTNGKPQVLEIYIW
jgi:hypothetical protein